LRSSAGAPPPSKSAKNGWSGAELDAGDLDILELDLVLQHLVAAGEYRGALFEHRFQLVAGIEESASATSACRIWLISMAKVASRCWPSTTSRLERDEPGIGASTVTRPPKK
jgi:hypothetical protein